jgi:hypothetical protein
MDFSKLSQNEKLAVYGAIASVVGPILATAGFGFGVGFFTLLLALAMLAIVFLPQWSPQTTLPGSKGSLMVIVGGIAALSAAFALIGSIGYLSAFGSNIVFVIGWLIGIAGGLLMGWAGWQEFQAEGGKLQIGTPASGTTATSATTADRAPADPAPAPAGSAPAPADPAPAPTPPAPASAAPPADPDAAAPAAADEAPPSDPEQRPPA